MILGVGEPARPWSGSWWFGVLPQDVGGLLVDRLVPNAVRSNQEP